jgi:hypothetical protein
MTAVGQVYYVSFNPDQTWLLRAKKSVGVLIGSLELEDEPENWVWGLEQYIEIMKAYLTQDDGSMMMGIIEIMKAYLTQDDGSMMMGIIEIRKEINRLKEKVDA